MTSERGARSRVGLVLGVVGVCAVGLSFLIGVVLFFVPSQPETPLLAALSVFGPGVVGIVGFGLAVTGLVLVLSR